LHPLDGPFASLDGPFASLDGPKKKTLVLAKKKPIIRPALCKSAREVLLFE